jgi:four helix bundle protein
MHFTNMRMYQVAEALVREVDPLLTQCRRAAPLQARHLERSADSVLFNTAEGIAAFRPRVKINAYDIARREASEVRAVLRRLVIKRALSHSQIARAYELAGLCVAMLTNAIRSIETRPEA